MNKKWKMSYNLCFPKMRALHMCKFWNSDQFKNLPLEKRVRDLFDYRNVFYAPAKHLANFESKYQRMSRRMQKYLRYSR